MVSERASQRVFFGVSALLFAASSAVTIVWCTFMSAMGEMPMPGDWTMSMTWVLMPGQNWFFAAASFLGMWIVMMVAMMLPSLVPMLWRYRQAVSKTNETHLGRLTALVGVGYFFNWTIFGMAAFPLGAALAALEMQQPALARAVPIRVVSDRASNRARITQLHRAVSCATSTEGIVTALVSRFCGKNKERDMRMPKVVSREAWLSARKDYTAFTL